MTRLAFPMIAAASILAGCATVPEGDEMAERDAGGGAGMCDAQAGQRYVGSKADSQTGGAILAATGARSLRWGPPNAVFTMDFRQDRVNVMYDADLTITEIRCG